MSSRACAAPPHAIPSLWRGESDDVTHQNHWRMNQVASTGGLRRARGAPGRRTYAMCRQRVTRESREVGNDPRPTSRGGGTGVEPMTLGIVSGCRSAWWRVGADAPSLRFSLCSCADRSWSFSRVSPKRGRTPAELGRVWWNDASARTPAIPTVWTKKTRDVAVLVLRGQCYARYSGSVPPCPRRVAPHLTTREGVR